MTASPGRTRASGFPPLTEDVEGALEAELARWRSLWDAIEARTSARVVQGSRRQGSPCELRRDRVVLRQAPLIGRSLLAPVEAGGCARRAALVNVNIVFGLEEEFGIRFGVDDLAAGFATIGELVA